MFGIYKCFSYDGIHPVEEVDFYIRNQSSCFRKMGFLKAGLYYNRVDSMIVGNFFDFLALQCVLPCMIRSVLSPWASYFSVVPWVFARQTMT